MKLNTEDLSSIKNFRIVSFESFRDNLIEVSKENKVAPVEKINNDEESYEKAVKELLLEGVKNPTSEEIYEKAEKAADDAEKAKELKDKMNDSKKKKRASAWFMGKANVLVINENDEGEVKNFNNKDIAEEWVQNNLEAGQCAEISVVYKRFSSKEVVVNQIVED